MAFKLKTGRLLKNNIMKTVIHKLKITEMACKRQMNMVFIKVNTLVLKIQAIT